MNIILANCPVNNGNRGCVALSLSTMYIIDKLLNEKNISHTFFLPQSGFEKMGNYTLKAGSIELKFKAIADISCYNFKRRLKNLVKYKQYFKTRNIYKKADCILDIGQGDSFADIYGKDRFDWIYSQYELGRKFNLPYCILPQTIGPFKDPSIRERAIAGINRAKCVMVRDKQSYDFVKQLLPQNDISEIIDVAFFMPFEKKIFDSNYIHVGLNISSLLWHGGYTNNNQFDLIVDYQALIRSILQYFLTLDHVKVHLIPHVVSGERTIENDYAVSYDLYEEFNNPNLILAPLFLDPIIAKNYIAGMNFFMGARMHATIAAFSSGVPVFPMAYSRKFNGLFTGTLKYKYLVDMKTNTVKETLNILERGFNNRKELENIIINITKNIISDRKCLLVNELIKFFNLKIKATE